MSSFWHWHDLNLASVGKSDVFEIIEKDVPATDADEASWTAGAQPLPDVFYDYFVVERMSS